ncbi:hypothetical protein BDZ89DRAFT_1056663 [Hymenopellis radicata]|nr:hypothetical protein BDZ89DRAFT_1056663 [Hymenopellis radicata]
MQPSEYEIQREVEALRDLKRRSATPGALSIDPDLPNPSSASSPTSSYWSGDGDSSSASHEDSSSSEDTSLSGGPDGTNQPADDPFHLFWVPASVHPEIAPAEFRAFLKEHARNPPPSDGGPSRSSSLSSSSSLLGRKRSMLSRQYRPSENDGVGDEEEQIVPLRRNRTSMYNKQGPQLTISDLQRLEELAEEASESDDPSKLRSILRRSLSFNVSPTAIDKMDDMPDMGDEADVPIIVPPPNQILRRANRTKIRKPGLPGDGNGHRFGSTRRGAAARSGTNPVTLNEKRTSGDRSSSEHGDDAQLTRRRTFDAEVAQPRPESSYSEEASIFDAYVREDDEDDQPMPVVVSASPPPEPSLELPPIQADSQTSLFDALEPVLHHPQPQRLLSPPISEQPQQPSRTPSPAEAAPPSISPPRSPEPALTPAAPTPTHPTSQPAFLSAPPSPQPQRKDKDKKGLFGKWGADKGGKKATAKDKERETRERAEKEKESGFFGSLFGGKKHKESEGVPMGVHGVAAGREAAAALLGSSKSAKSYQPPPSPVGSPGVNNWSRYPIHVERAIYRLSHIKLANPRRPLYEQVLISNLMFWYLGVINKAQNPTTPPNGQANAAGAGAGAGPAGLTAQQQQEKEREQQEKLEKERLEKEQKEKEGPEAKKREASPRRGPLTKPAPAGAGGRRAEMPVKSPQYDMQHHAMEEEYGYGGGYNNPTPQSQNRPASTPPATGAPQPYRQPQIYQQTGQDTNGADYYYSADSQQYQQPQQQQRLPPGAMQPLEPSGWPQQPGSQRPRNASKSPPPSPIMQGFNAAMTSPSSRTPSRSLSATAIPSPTPPPVNGKLRKGHSAYAGTTAPTSTSSNGRRPRTAEEQETEDEDVPLALWQQQQATYRRR